MISKSRVFTGTLSRLSSKGFSTSCAALSGHSRWSTIKRDKAKNDMERSKVYFKMSQKITFAAKTGGGDPIQNIQLQYAIDDAKKSSVPKKIIDTAIKRGTGELVGEKPMESVVYEGMAAGGVGVIVEALTDNKTRTFQKVREVFNNRGTGLSATAYLFERKGSVIIDCGELSFEDIFEKAIELGAEDVEELPIDPEDNPDGKLVELVTSETDTGKIANALKQEFNVTEVSINYVPLEDMAVEVTDEDVLKRVEKLTDFLHDIDDVSDVYLNMKR
ncbi:unnamed protein product [Kuraishia capsulata CBS 1993]|uniref:Transcriptional regulatory protein n=1 Tax=Kuraishia capsulata CBS 1993 TaxID=1382522 RepID=W6MW58_9ASCO|nr:uncharacterized protein KUCA_T00002897001 [Kuraishia capsulata CBS 1993]CDK26920.1 unnamed protein product [Kuraishia capsulata CBS 1993]